MAQLTLVHVTACQLAEANGTALSAASTADAVSTASSIISASPVTVFVATVAGLLAHVARHDAPARWIGAAAVANTMAAQYAGRSGGAARAPVTTA